MKVSSHHTHPTHYYVDHASYFLTASLWRHRRLLDDDVKTYLIELFHQVFAQYGWQLHEWVVLDNHYHLLCTSQSGKDLPMIVRTIHSLSAVMIREHHPKLEGRVWYNYWDYCPRNEQEYNTRLCYLLNNPRKHGYVEQLDDWQWSSFHNYADEREGLRATFLKHPDYRRLALSEDSFESLEASAS